MRVFRLVQALRKNLQFILILFSFLLFSCTQKNIPKTSPRERISFNENWKFFKYSSEADADNLIYDIRPEIMDRRDDRDADSKPTEAIASEESKNVLKSWILPTSNNFIKNPENRHIRPEGNPGGNFPFVQNNFDDSSWEDITLPHDWASSGPFQEGLNAEVTGGMGRLPVNGVAWYRKSFEIYESDRNKSIFFDIDGAMSYAMVWCNGKLVGGWPYGYNSWRLDLTPYIVEGKNQLAIRVDNPNNSARWYPGAGIYRNVWLIKTNRVHVAQWGTFITTKNVSKESATVDIKINIDNDSEQNVDIEILTQIFSLNENEDKGKEVAAVPRKKVSISAGNDYLGNSSLILNNPLLWGPPPTQYPNLYLAVTTIESEGKIIDTYETQFGIRQLEFNPEKGILINGELIKIKGVNQHHDLGALGAAFNTRAAERQLEILKELGCNAIRLAHNPPAPELLDLTDRMGFLVIDEIFDVWERKKTPHDFHLIFPDWYEPDTRSFIRRDRNHPSVILWSCGNEVGEQYTAQAGADVAKKLIDIIKDEDPTRLTTASMNFAKPGMEFPEVMEVITLNYQGEGIRDTPAYSHLQGIRTPPLYPAFRDTFPDKVIISSETASALSTRGTYIFPVFEGISSPIGDGIGGDPEKQYVSAYELYTANFGASPDKVFASQDKHPFVAGEFVWSGWDYIGEPTPYYGARSSYCGIIDLAGFKKDRFYLYQSRWRPELPIVHILPHWNWPQRIGEKTPVHVFTSGDEVELFLNGKSLGKKKKGEFEYRLRWDDVKYEPGEVKAIAYKNGKLWAENVIKTTDAPAKIELIADQTEVNADGENLVFISAKIQDKNGLIVPNADNLIQFSIEGSGEIVATDNGDPTDMRAFPSHERNAFNGLALVIVRPIKAEPGSILVKAKSGELISNEIKIKSN